MTKAPWQSPLRLLKEAESTELSEAEERERRRRTVERIETLRTQLATEHKASKPELKGATWIERLCIPAPTGWSLRDRWPWIAALVPVAAALFLWVQTRNASSLPLLKIVGGEVVVGAEGDQVHLGYDSQWDKADEVLVATGADEATVELPSHTSVKLGVHSRAQIQRVASVSSDASNEPDDGQVSATLAVPKEAEGVHLQQGALTLHARESLEPRVVRVYTGQTRVLVRGTQFAVLVERATSGERTRVVVHSGEASVWSGGQVRRLTPGQEWTSDDGRSIDGTDIRPGEAVPAPRVPEPDAGALPQGTSGARSPSQLGKQNQLFESAQAARRSGQVKLALQRFEALMRAYPGTEQAHNARVEHFRLLRQLGNYAEARKSAQVYLRSYPRGFASAEAQRLARGDH